MNSVKFKQAGLRRLLLVVGVALLSGCSTIDSSVDSVGSGMVSAGDSLQSLTGNVQTKKMNEKTFHLTEFYHEPVTTFDSWSLRSKAREVCPGGYVYDSRQALKMGKFADTHSECANDASCGYALEWRIRCEDVPYEPFSLFGKT
ncbi:MAG: hypothetical protein ISEC1_P1018 [Thiomicrorhabdus sp.]|nr:MAG: hypothetical protein ISEC1_P1018 [Thiomicrorhabdus sp.]